jgi:hypothetical protein
MKLLITTDWYKFRIYSDNKNFYENYGRKKYILELFNEHQELIFKTVIIHTVDIVKETIKEMKLQHKELKIGYKDMTNKC